MCLWKVDSVDTVLHVDMTCHVNVATDKYYDKNMCKIYCMSMLCTCKP